MDIPQLERPPVGHPHQQDVVAKATALEFLIMPTVDPDDTNGISRWISALVYFAGHLHGILLAGGAADHLTEESLEQAKSDNWNEGVRTGTRRVIGEEGTKQ